MELPKISMTDIKTKLGFADERDDAYDEEYYDDYADDYGEYGYDAELEDDPAKRYEPYTPVTTRPALGSRATTSPKLVSIDDVRERTQIPDSLRRDPLPARHVSSVGRSYGNRTMVDSSMPVPGSEQSATSSSPRRVRSEGYESLFSSTAEAAGRLSQAGSAASTLSAAATGVMSASSTAASAAAASSQKAAFDPYATYQGAGASAYAPTRSVTVLKPVSYDEVERVSKSLRAGDAVVLCLGNTPDHLVKRILDFTFGAASMVDARVDCIADKVFAVARGQELTDAERTTLRNQGVL